MDPQWLDNKINIKNWIRKYFICLQLYQADYYDTKVDKSHGQEYTVQKR